MKALMKVTTPEGEVFWMDGDDEGEARSSFGEDVTLVHFLAAPKQLLTPLMDEVRSVAAFDLGDGDWVLMDLRTELGKFDLATGGVV